MNIEPIDNVQPVLQSQVSLKQKDDKQPLPKDEALEKTTDVSRQQELVAKLKELDEVRPEVVQAGKRLANDPSFPKSEELDQLAKALLTPIMDSE